MQNHGTLVTPQTNVGQALKSSQETVTEKAQGLLSRAIEAANYSRNVRARVVRPMPAPPSEADAPAPSPDHLVFILEAIEAHLREVNSNLDATLSAL